MRPRKGRNGKKKEQDNPTTYAVDIEIVWKIGERAISRAQEFEGRDSLVDVLMRRVVLELHERIANLDHAAIMIAECLGKVEADAGAVHKFSPEGIVVMLVHLRTKEEERSAHRQEMIQQHTHMQQLFPSFLTLNDL